MGSFKPPRAFNSQDLETIQWVYEAAWARVVLRDPSRDKMHDAELQAFLRRRIFAFAQCSPVDFDTLCDRVVASITQDWASPPKAGQTRR
jgi:hypothetical protein